MQEPSERPSSTPRSAGLAAAVPDGTPEAEAAALDPSEDEEDAELEELLIREITIDGMCGVY